jgi:ArsR family transcriptional regulator, virulence genes transcriptional regulator
MDRDELERNARKASILLKAMANERRLLVLCHLAQGEKSVGELERLIGLSQSALSQHLARLRRDKLVRTRREAQTIYYALAGREAGAVMETLYNLYCEPVKAPLPPETAPPVKV